MYTTGNFMELQTKLSKNSTHYFLSLPESATPILSGKTKREVLTKAVSFARSNKYEKLIVVDAEGKLVSEKLFRKNKLVKR